MAYENNIEIYIDGVNRTPSAVLPLKFGNFLDERLDECRLSLRRIKKDLFSPLTPVEIEITNELKFDEVVSATAEKFYYVVADDDATEAQTGSDLFNHELYLIEVTKIAECYIVDTLTFTNTLGKTYTDNADDAQPDWE